jgi:hypothetical protein
MSSAAQTQAERDREILRSYVTGWIENGHTPSAKQLARLVCDAPAKQTLTDDEWWNVALLVSQELTHGG